MMAANLEEEFADITEAFDMNVSIYFSINSPIDKTKEFVLVSYISQVFNLIFATV